MSKNILAPAPLFHDHAVLQRDTPIPVWGTGTPGEKVHATLAGSTAETRVNPDGFWLIRIPPLPAGGPYELMLHSGESRLALHDILVGDVWICSGQSNMQFLLSQVDPNGEQSAGCDLAEIRLLSVSTPACANLQSNPCGRWLRCTPDTLANFSAVGGYFGRKLHQELNVPIGLIANAWGGTRIQAWLSREALMTLPEGVEEVETYERLLYGPVDSETEIFPNFDAWFQAKGPEQPGNPGLDAGWATPDFDDSRWPSMPLPSRWQDQGHDFNGIFWFRKLVKLPAAWRGRPLKLDLGCIDKHDQTYVNGVQVGSMGWENPNSWSTPREYEISAELTNKSDTLLIAVRVRSHQYHGGMTGPASRMKLGPAGEEKAAVVLAGDWTFAIEQNWGIITAPPGTFQGGNGPDQPNAPYSMFNSRNGPVLGYGIRGWLWYQGESNGDEGPLYRRLLPLMIDDWRRVWAQGPLPFLIVQLANYKPAKEIPCEKTGWSLLRDAQLAALKLPNVGMAVAIDVGDAMDIHPKDKKTVGLRLAQWALARVYGRGGLPGGPRLRGIRQSANGRLRLSFDDSAGLRTRDNGPIRWLAIADSRRNFVWAHSRIDGEELELWHPDIPHPAAACYAWAINPEGCNLVNQDDYPASPFHTDISLGL
jgi:sialate O-acetylesterase